VPCLIHALAGSGPAILDAENGPPDLPWHHMIDNKVAV
jgi:hypothetical protein